MNVFTLRPDFVAFAFAFVFGFVRFFVCDYFFLFSFVICSFPRYFIRFPFFLLVCCIRHSGFWFLFAPNFSAAIDQTKRREENEKRANIVCFRSFYFVSGSRCFCFSLFRITLRCINETSQETKAGRKRARERETEKTITFITPSAFLSLNDCRRV